MSEQEKKPAIRVDGADVRYLSARLEWAASHPSTISDAKQILTRLFERQVELEELVNEQQKLLQECYETIEAEYGNGPTILQEITEVLQRVNVLIEQIK